MLMKQFMKAPAVWVALFAAAAALVVFATPALAQLPDPTCESTKSQVNYKMALTVNGTTGRVEVTAPDANKIRQPNVAFTVRTSPTSKSGASITWTQNTTVGYPNCNGRIWVGTVTLPTNWYHAEAKLTVPTFTVPGYTPNSVHTFVIDGVTRTHPRLVRSVPDRVVPARHPITRGISNSGYVAPAPLVNTGRNPGTVRGSHAPSTVTGGPTYENTNDGYCKIHYQGRVYWASAADCGF